MVSNDTTYGYFRVQEPIGQWNGFSRNLTADYLTIPTFGGSLPINFQVQGIYFYAFSSIANNELVAFVDDVYLVNGTTTHIGGATQDGNFESGTGDPWLNSYNMDHSYVAQSSLAHSGSSSCNITTASAGGVIIIVTRTSPVIVPVGIVAIPPGAVIVVIPVIGIIRIITAQTRIAHQVTYPHARLSVINLNGINLTDDLHRISGGTVDDPFHLLLSRRSGFNHHQLCITSAEECDNT